MPSGWKTWKWKEKERSHEQLQMYGASKEFDATGVECKWSVGVEAPHHLRRAMLYVVGRYAGFRGSGSITILESKNAFRY